MHFRGRFRVRFIAAVCGALVDGYARGPACPHATWRVSRRQYVAGARPGPAPGISFRALSLRLRQNAAVHCVLRFPRYSGGIGRMLATLTVRECSVRRASARLRSLCCPDCAGVSTVPAAQEGDPLYREGSASPTTASNLHLKACMLCLHSVLRQPTSTLSFPFSCLIAGLTRAVPVALTAAAGLHVPSIAVSPPPVPVNDPPTVVDHVLNTTEGAAVTSVLTEGARVGPPNEAGQTYQGCAWDYRGGAAHGRVFVLDPVPICRYRYTSDPGFAGTAWMDYIVSDNGGTANGGSAISPTRKITIYGEGGGPGSF